MNKWTEGEWVTTPDGYRVGALREDGLLDRLVCVTAHNNSERTCTAKANAHLISAAPELYGALAIIRPLMWEDIKRGHGLFSDAELSRVDAAIAKARGER